MDISDIDILWCVLLFLWIVYFWETYLSLRQVNQQSRITDTVLKHAKLHKGHCKRHIDRHPIQCNIFLSFNVVGYQCSLGAPP